MPRRLSSSLSQSGAALRPGAAAAEHGFTLIELLTVMIILGILTAVAVPAYMSLQDRADKGAAMTIVRAAGSDIEAYYADNGTFDGISETKLKTYYDATLDATLIQVASEDSGQSFMACAKSHGWYGYKIGPADSIHTDSVPPTTDPPGQCTL
jgi:prepilin-type N-terminal cleavage/methylation domain-containing protein